MEDLKPCPFCGGEAKAFFCDKSGTYDVQCQQCGALPFIGHRRGCDGMRSMDDVVAAWNRRAERTCRNVYKERRHEMYWCDNAFECSECGCVVEDYEGYRVKGTFNFCPACGKKVVG